MPLLLEWGLGGHYDICSRTMALGHSHGEHQHLLGYAIKNHKGQCQEKISIASRLRVFGKEAHHLVSNECFQDFTNNWAKWHKSGNPYITSAFFFSRVLATFLVKRKSGKVLKKGERSEQHAF